ncbi:MAG: hypothetical protein IT350_06685 [Deltaproteobacteria bacterium]|nr:hypothetical protein [Deltaproteobacteria bacterium]
MKSCVIAVLCLTLIVVAAGCGPKDKPEEEKPAKKSAMDEGAARMLGTTRELQKPQTLNTYAWTLPEGWTEKPAKGMRAASFDIKIGDVTADAAITELVGKAGGLEANITRWRKQVELPPMTPAEIEAAGKADQMKFGSFKYYRMENPKLAERAFFAALATHGNVTVFVKLTAKYDDLSKFEPAFLEFCRSLDVKTKE